MFEKILEVTTNAFLRELVTELKTYEAISHEESLIKSEHLLDLLFEGSIKSIVFTKGAIFTLHPDTSHRLIGNRLVANKLDRNQLISFFENSYCIAIDAMKKESEDKIIDELVIFKNDLQRAGFSLITNHYLY